MIKGADDFYYSLCLMAEVMLEVISWMLIMLFLLPDKRRMKIVDLGGAQGLVNMLAGAKDDRTRRLALKALVAISKSGQI